MSSARFDAQRQLRQARFQQLLAQLEGQGLTQQDIAQRTGVQAQYLSDVKTGRRPMSELFAHRLQAEFGLSFHWLWGTSGAPHSGGGVASDVGRLWLPVFAHPVRGEPCALAAWDGTSVELTGAATAQALSAEQPYVLRFGAADRCGRLRKNDLLLISQAINTNAEIQVVELRAKCFLARDRGPRGWEAVAPQRTLTIEPVRVGHCLGIVWAAL